MFAHQFCKYFKKVYTKLERTQRGASHGHRGTKLY